MDIIVKHVNNNVPIIFKITTNILNVRKEMNIFNKIY